MTATFVTFLVLIDLTFQKKNILLQVPCVPTKYFSDAEQESAAVATGNKTKVQKVATKIQKERLLLSNPAEIVKQEAVLNSTWFPFLGAVSTLKAKDGLQIGHIMGLPFFVSPPPATSPASRTIVPAWLLLTTRKAEYSTLQPGKHTLKAATWHIVANCPFHILLLPLTH